MFLNKERVGLLLWSWSQILRRTAVVKQNGVLSNLRVCCIISVIVDFGTSFLFVIVVAKFLYCTTNQTLKTIKITRRIKNSNLYLKKFLINKRTHGHIGNSCSWHLLITHYINCLLLLSLNHRKIAQLNRLFHKQFLRKFIRKV